MEKPYIIHMFTPAKNLSPFDVNMALDASWTNSIPYTQLETDEIEGMVQDAIFSRSAKGVRRTGIFIGGRDMHMAIDMLQAARKAMIPPFEVSVFADPSGAFTTAAGMVAKVEKQLETVHSASLEGANVLTFGGTGPVGSTAALLSAKAGANVTIIGRQQEKAQRVAKMVSETYGENKISISGAADADKAELIKTADVVFATAAAGVQVLNAELVSLAPQLKVAADVNAVPPSGIAGLEAHHDGNSIAGSNSGAVGVGALAIGNVKYQTQQRMLISMHKSDAPVYLHFDDAFAVAREYVSSC